MIIIVPLFDFVFTKGNGRQILYSFNMDTFLYTYLNGFNPFAEISTATRGVRVEILTAFLAVFLCFLLCVQGRAFKALPPASCTIYYRFLLRIFTCHLWDVRNRFLSPFRECCNSDNKIPQVSLYVFGADRFYFFGDNMVACTKKTEKI